MWNYLKIQKGILAGIILSVVALVLTFLTSGYLAGVAFFPLSLILMMFNVDVFDIGENRNFLHFLIFTVVGIVLYLLLGFLFEKSYRKTIKKTYFGILGISLVSSVIISIVFFAIGLYSYRATMSNGNDFQEMTTFVGIMGALIFVIWSVICSIGKKISTRQQNSESKVINY